MGTTTGRATLKNARLQLGLTAREAGRLAEISHTLVGYYEARFDDLSATNLYPLGGQEHRETILQSCRDIATQYFRDDDEQLCKREHDRFMERLRASVEHDRRNSPDFIGFNNDGSCVVVNRHGSDFTCTLRHNLGGGP